MELFFHWVPARDGRAATDELNELLRSRRVLSVERHFCSTGPEPGWAVCVECANTGDGRSSDRTGRKNNVDYREVLDAETFTLFAALRAWRKAAAEKEGVPPYAILTNEQMAQVAERRCKTVGELETIAGFGTARSRKYGEGILELLNRSTPAETRGTDGA